jgi:hypothetical protein
MGNIVQQQVKEEEDLQNFPKPNRESQGYKNLLEKVAKIRDEEYVIVKSATV